MKIENFYENNNNHINGLKFNDSYVGGQNSKPSISISSYIKEIEDSLEILYMPKEVTDTVEISHQKEIIMDSIHCCFISAMREELNFGRISNDEFKELSTLQERMKNIADETGNEFIKLQTGFVSILVSYIDKNS